MMTKQRIGQYTSLKREIAMLEDQIYSASCGGEFVTDMVRGSMKQPPYAQHNIVIQGFGSDAVPKLSARKAKCIAECAAIEQFIEQIADSTLRQLFTRRYIEGRTTAEAAQLVGYSRKQATRLINGYFEKMSHDVP